MADGRPTYDTHCCIVGGGPAGMILALLLGRAGVPTTLLEEHEGFNRDFRGDTVHPSTMELMDQLGLANRLLQLADAKIHQLNFDTPTGSIEMANLSRLPTKFPYITMMPQARFLDFLAGEMDKLPSVRRVMRASVQGLLWGDEYGGSGVADRAGDAPARGPAPEDGHGALPDDAIVRGVRYRSNDGWHEVRSPLVIGADGRFSRVRRLAGIERVKTAPPMDIMWFRLPRRSTESEDGRGKLGHGHMMVILNRGDEWQIALVIAKGSYKEIHDAGLPAFRKLVAEMAPEYADRVDTLQDWHQVALLAVEAGRVQKWFRPGLLLIGDAAHVMTPIGGVGINYAIQDAVVTANVLTTPLKSGRLKLSDLAGVQRRREIPTRIIQGMQGVLQQQVVAKALG
jgi:2-polyprenyl-6-methoxyphenol hydroxylase-like FAD-dependent oxidoreductase